jgi:DNA-binding protein YbaB
VNEVEQAEQRRQASERLTEVLAVSTGTAQHPSGLATVTATATGELKWLRLHPSALAQGPEAVSRIVVETARLATDAAVQRGYNELAKSLGDSMAIAIEGFAGPSPFARAALAQAAPQAVLPPSAPQPQSAPPFSPSPRTSAPGTRRPPAPLDEDEDAYFADPFGTGGSRR